MPRLGERRLLETSLQAGGMSIRIEFRIAIGVLVAVAFLLTIGISYLRVRRSEFVRSSNSVHSEVNYLCLQLESLGARAEAFGRVVDALDPTAKNVASVDSRDLDLLSDPVGDVLRGYTLAETGTVVIAANGTVLSSDNESFPPGASLRELLGTNAYESIDAALASNEMQRIRLEGALSNTGEREGYLMAGQQGDYTIVIVEPLSMVFRNLWAIIWREAYVSLLVLLVVFFVVDRLLVLLVARRIDKTNSVLQQVVFGDLGARVEIEGSREFRSLARGIDVTVDALQGWIAEAESRMDAELATARDIQEGALPRRFPPFPDIPKFDIYALMDAAKEVGGDFYDFFLVGKGSTAEEGKLAFVMADVSGKGIPAALFMMKAKAVIRECLGSGGDLGAAVTRANKRICDSNDVGMFVTAWIGVLDYGTGVIEYVNAGHNPPLLRTRNGEWQWLRERSGPMMGVFEVPFSTRWVTCEPGDTLLLYTDGVTEAYDVNQDLYGEDRLIEFAEGAGPLGPEELVLAVRKDVAAYAEGAEQSDDVTIMALELKSSS